VLDAAQAIMACAALRLRLGRTAYACSLARRRALDL
jgi:hypothetical protein